MPSLDNQNQIDWFDILAWNSLPGNEGLDVKNLHGKNAMQVFQIRGNFQEFQPG
jgi:hypothetical protein